MNDTGEPRTERTLPEEDVSALLARFGVVPLVQRASVETIVAEELAARGYQARVIELRHGRLLLESGPAEVALLRYDETALLATLRERAPGLVESLRVRVRRG